MAPIELEEYRIWIEHSPVLFWRAGPDAARSYFNVAWLAFTGRALEQELGWGWAEGIHPDDMTAYRFYCQEHVERRQPFEVAYRLRRFDGSYRAIIERGAPYTDANGAFGGFVGTSVNAVDRDNVELSIGAPDFFERSLDHLVVAGFDGYIKRVNPAWTRTLGWSAEELTSRPSVEFVHPEDREATLGGRQKLKGGSDMGSLVNRYLCKDGTFRWFEWRSVADVERGLIYAAARDITEQKVAEQRLVEAKELQEKLQRQLIFADRMASVGTLAAGVAHEVNNPLSFVVANIAMIADGLASLGDERSSSPVKDLLEMAQDVLMGAERIRKIVRSLRTFARVHEERLRALDVKPVLELAVNLTFNEFRHRARLTRDYGTLPLVEGDEGRLGQVFVNLLVNAAQAIPEGDSAANEIRIVTSTDAAGRPVVEIRDTGAGIPAHLLSRVFDPFFTTKPVGVGTGLGLSICHNIVTAMGGEITVASEVGRGTTVRVVLNTATEGASEAAAAFRTDAPAPKTAMVSAAILVVDDEPAIGTTLRRVLREHEVTAVTTATEALDLLASGKRFDVVFSDVLMPEMSGMDFYDQLTRRFPGDAEQVIFVSGGAFTPAAAAFLERIPNERLEKPFDPQHVRDMVQRRLAR